MRVYLDTNILVYAVGRGSSRRDPCRAILGAVAEGRVAGETSAYTLQEFVRQRVRRGDPQAIGRARHAAELLAEIHPVDRSVMARAVDIVEHHPGFDVADAVHVATALIHGVPTIVSSDHGLDRIAAIERIDPLDRDRLASLMGK